MDEAEYCNRLGLIYRGELIALGTPHELKAGMTRQPGGTGLASGTPVSLEDVFIARIEERDRAEPKQEEVRR
jgi:ABC-2 type transport system ATP-binding protein